MVNGRPSYIDYYNNYGMWWNGQAGENGDWMIGIYSDIDNNRITYGFMTNDQDTSCPSQSEHWDDYYNSEWAANVNAHVSCDGTYQ